MSGVTAHIGGLASFIQPEYRIPVLVEVRNSASLMASSKFAIASQLIGQLLLVIDGPPQKFAVRIAILQEIRDAWAADQEVLVTTLSDRCNTSQREDELTASEFDPSNKNPAVIGQSSGCPQGAAQEPCAGQDLEDSVDGRDQLKLTDTKTEDGGSVTSLDLRNLLREGEGCGDSGARDSDNGGKLSNDTTYNDADDLDRGLFEKLTDILMPEPSGDQDVGSGGKTGSPQNASNARPVDTVNEHLSLICKRCGQSFRVGESSLDRPFACPHCQQNSSRQGPSLLGETGITSNQSKAATPAGAAAGASKKSTRPFPCKVCKKEFKRKDHLADHFRIHTNEKPFSCSICGKKFRSKSNRRKHEKTHQDERGVPQPSQARKERVLNPPTIDTESSSRLPIAEMQQSHQMSTAIQSKTKSNTSEAGSVFDKESYSTPASGSTLHQKTQDEKKSYSCDVCDVVYASIANLIVHRKSHRIQCKKCNILFPTRVDLEYHNKTCGSVRTSSKAEAGKGRPTLVSRGILKKYEQIRKTNNAHFCTSCKKVFPTVRDLRCHKQIHLNLKPHVCDTCNKSFNSASHLKAHKRVHTGEKPFRCSLCERKFSQNSNLKNHWKNVHKLEILGCKYCRKTFLDPDKLRHHEQNYHRVMKRHPAQGDLVLDGGDGSTKNVSTDDRTKNLSTAPPCMNQYACDVCTESFKNLRGRQTHYKIHISKSLFHCEHCRESFSSKSSLSEHVASVHAKMLFNGKVCSKGLLSYRDLRAHEKIYKRELQIEPDISESGSAQCQLMPGRAQEDQTERTYQCHQCKNAFTRKDSLVRHIKTHTNKRRYVCYQCGGTFASKYNLTRHKETQHRPSRCATCREFFPSKAALKRHATVCHNSERHPDDADVPVTGDPGVQKESLQREYLQVESPTVQLHRADESTARQQAHASRISTPQRTSPARSQGPTTTQPGTPNQSNRSLKTVTQNQSQTFSCRVCHKVFLSQELLQSHECAHAVDNLQSVASTPVATKKVSKTNAVSGRFICEYCRKTFNNRSHWREHLRVHTGEKPFSCNICGRAFTTRSSVKKHKLTHIKH